MNPTNYNRVSGSIDLTAGYRLNSNISFNFALSNVMNSTGGGNTSRSYRVAARFNY